MTSAFITNEQNVYYYMNLSIGSPPQEMTFLIDSGSAWLWADSNECFNCLSTANDFNYRQSNTFRITDD